MRGSKLDAIEPRRLGLSLRRRNFLQTSLKFGLHAPARIVALAILWSVMCVQLALAGPGFSSNLGLLDRLTEQAMREAADSLGLEPGCAVTILSETPKEGSGFVIRRLARVLADRGHRVQMVINEPEPIPEEGEGEAEGAGAGAGLQEAMQQHGAAANHPGRQTHGPRAVAQPDSAQAYADSIAAAEGYPTSTPNEETPPPVEEPLAHQQSEPMHVARASSAATGSLPSGDVIDVDVLEFGVTYADASRRMLFGPLRFWRVAGTYIQVSHLKGPEGTLKRVVSVERHAVDHLSGSQRILAEGATYPFSRPALMPPSLGRYVEPAVVVGIVGSLIYLFYQNQN